MHAKLYLLFRDDKISPVIGYLGSSNLTLAGLLHQGELNVDVLEQDAALKLTKWFEDRWCIDISKELADIIDTSWAADRLVSPYHIYLKIAYHLSREARAGMTELAGRLEAAASNPHSSPNTRDNRVYPFKPYDFLVVSDPLELL